MKNMASFTNFLDKFLSSKKLKLCLENDTPRDIKDNVTTAEKAFFFVNSGYSIFICTAWATP